MKTSNASTTDLPIIAHCHMAAFPESLTTQFGHSFVTQMLGWYLSGNNKFLFWIEEDGKCIGYCGGHVMDGTDAYGAGSGMTQFGFNAALIAFIKKPWLLVHPEVRKKYAFMFRNIKHRFKRLMGIPEPIQPIEQFKETHLLEAGLVVIGVLPTYQGKGIGKMLLTEFDRIAIQMGAKQVSLSVRKINEAAIVAYKKNGYTIQMEDETSYIMKKKLTP